MPFRFRRSRPPSSRARDRASRQLVPLATPVKRSSLRREDGDDEQAVKAIGLYDPAYEHDACGVAFVARLDGVASHETVVRALTALANLEHRGAEGAHAGSGAGAGMPWQLPDAL
jgi:hypothetical protein